MPLPKLRVENHSQHEHLDRNGKIRQEPALKAALLADAWVLDDAARALGMRREVDYAAIVRAMPFEVVEGAAVALRPANSKIYAPWRQGVEDSRLAPIDRAVDGDERLARRLSSQEVVARAAAYATMPGIDVVIVAGVVDHLDGLAGACAAYGRLLAVADCHRGAVHAFAAAADFIVELDAQCFPQPPPGPRASRYVEVAQ